jgi:hypothetical protein
MAFSTCRKALARLRGVGKEFASAIAKLADAQLVLARRYEALTNYVHPIKKEARQIRCPRSGSFRSLLEKVSGIRYLRGIAHTGSPRFPFTTRPPSSGF